MGTGGELILSVLLVLGLGSRFAALGLFVVNLVAVVALADIAPAALQLHQFWGSLLAGLVVFGPGCIALDYFFQKYFNRAVTKSDSRTNYTQST
jgi:putative oxidoreductase